MRDHFTKDDAMRILGRSLCTRVAFENIPIGTEGYVSNIYHYNGTAEYGVTIQWFLDYYRVDNFSKDEYEKYITWHYGEPSL